jgi:hypothetical protein
VARDDENPMVVLPKWSAGVNDSGIMRRRCERPIRFWAGWRAGVVFEFEIYFDSNMHWNNDRLQSMGGDGGEIPQIRADLPCQPCDKFTYSRAVVPKKCVNTWCVISNSLAQVQESLLKSLPHA